MKCEICNQNIATHTCKTCNRRVCPEDYDHGSGRCSVCKTTLCEICNKYLSIGVCKHCGRQGCEACLIQVSLIDYVCIDCYRRGLR